jgi:hypothetical protein
MTRIIVAAILTAVATGALAWWLKGDLELAWLLVILVLLGASCVIGFVAALVVRAPIAYAAVFAVAAAPMIGAVALMVAMETPNAWNSPGRTGMERQATSVAADLPRIEARVRELLGAGVDVLGTHVIVHGGRVRKEPLRFALEREPAVAEIHVDFALGPDRGLALRVDGDSLVADPAALDSARKAPWRINAEALERRFDAPAMRLGRVGVPPWEQGTLLPLRLEYGEDDWSLLVLRVGGPQGLEVVRTISRDESRDALARAAARTGREVSDVRIYFTPSYRGVTFEIGADFDFVGIPVDRRGSVPLVARFRDGDFVYETRTIRPTVGGQDGPPSRGVDSEGRRSTH